MYWARETKGINICNTNGKIFYAYEMKCNTGEKRYYAVVNGKRIWAGSVDELKEKVLENGTK